MTTSNYPQSTHFSEDFAISCGSVLFRPSTDGNKSRLDICLLYERNKSEWLLPKGRKDQHETIEAAAVRETYEETGYTCKLLPVRMATRATCTAQTITRDAVEVVDGLTEPFALTFRHYANSVKTIFWFITIADSDTKEKATGTQAEWEAFDSVFVPADEAEERLTFAHDREIVKKALQIARENGM
jgi:8-oxo-dGTP pyrophosphatase MutT (NUDIX family)